MTPPKIQALGVTQDGWTMRWKATGDVEGVFPQWKRSYESLRL